MKKLFVTPIKLVLSFVKGCACLAVLAAVALFVMLNRFEGTVSGADQVSNQELNEIIAQQNRVIAEQDAQIEELLGQLGTTYQVHRRLNLRLLPGLEWEWLEFRCFDFWDEVSKSSYESCVEGQREILYSSGFLQWSFTTLERTAVD